MKFDNNIPIYLQVIHDMKKSVISGELALGDKLPSTRELALKYQINPNTAARIYKEMEMEGICFTKRGLGSYVTEDAEIILHIKHEMADELLKQFIMGMQHMGISKQEVISLIQDNYDKDQELGQVFNRQEDFAKTE